MRHFLLPRAIVARSLGMVAATTVTRLVTASGLALRIAPRLLGTFSRAVDLTAIATGADQYLDTAARTKIEAGGCMSLFSFVTAT
jgi:hypothetical protein